MINEELLIQVSFIVIFLSKYSIYHEILKATDEPILNKYKLKIQTIRIKRTMYTIHIND